MSEELHGGMAIPDQNKTKRKHVLTASQLFFCRIKYGFSRGSIHGLYDEVSILLRHCRLTALLALGPIR